MSRGIYDKVNKVRIPIAGAQVPNVDDVLLATSENPVQNRIIKSALDNKANSSDIPSKTSELTNDSNFIQDANYKHINVDNALSTTSTNPVQNKVIKSALDNKADNSNVPTKTSDLTNDSNFVADANYTHIDIDSTLSDTSENPVQNKVIKSALDNKLGTNDIAAWAKESTKPTYTASEVGLGNVGNFKAVSTEVNQGLSETEKSNARTNIGAGTSSFSGSYNDLTNKPTIPTVNNAMLTIQKNGTNVQTFTANQSTNATANITVPTKVSDLTNDSGYTTNKGTVTKISTGIGLTGGDITTTGTISLASGVVTPSSAGPTAAVTGNNNTTVAIPRIIVDTYGRVTGLTSYNLTNVNTTYSSQTAASGGTAVSLVTTGEKYTWNNKQDKLHFETKMGTLAAGATFITLTFTSETIGTNTLVEVFTDTVGVNYTNISTTSTTVTLTFDAQSAAIKVAVQITN